MGHTHGRFRPCALGSGALGFGVIAGTAALIAKVLFVVFLVLFVASYFRSRKA